MPIVRTTGAERVRIGGMHACVLDAGGAARCWTSGFSGEPQTVSSTIAFTDLAIGSAHTCGLGTDGKAYCWGMGDNGELGTGVRVHNLQSQPAAVSGDLHFVSLSAQERTTCGVTDAGSLLCWGVLADGDVPIPGASRCGTTVHDKSGPVTYFVTCALSPLRMPVVAPGSDTTFVTVRRTCAGTAQRSVYCYRNYRMEQVAPPGSFVSIAVGYLHVCGLDASGGAKCWGENSQGQRGDGSTSYSSVPVAVTGGHVFTEIVAGGGHTCGLAVAGDLWCWGANLAGQVGVPMRSDTRVPRRVRGQP
jgi:alpha-tubulin suppressor-like RCC1 family protein